MGSRKARINVSIQRVLSEAVAALEDESIGFVTITKVDVSGDLSRARVGFTVLGPEADREQTAEALSRATPALQAALANGVRMRRTPQLTFVYDGSTDHAMRITHLLSEAADDRDADTNDDQVDE